MPIGSDFTINYTGKTVTHTSGTTVYTVLQFFQWLAATFPEAAQMDDDYAFVSDTPTVYRWVNGWDMGDEASYQFLKGGSVESSDAQKLYSNLYSIGDQYRSSQIYIIQNLAEVNPWWGTGNIDILLKVKSGGVLIDSGNVLVMSRDSDGLFDHNVTNLAGGGRNPVGINTFQDLNYLATGDLYLHVASTTGFDAGNYAYGNTSTASGRIQYVDVANKRLYLCQVEGTFQVSETIKERTSRTAGDTGDSTTNDGSTPFTNVIVSYTDIKILFVQRKFTGGTTAGGPFQIGETLTQATSGWTGKFVAEVGSVLYVQHTAGTADGTHQITGGTSGATYTPTGTSVQATVDRDLNNGNGAQPYNVVVDGNARSMIQVYQYLKYACAHNSGIVVGGTDGEQYLYASAAYAASKQAPFGTFAGGTFFGARGIWIQGTATAAFQLTDANGSTQNPPNYQKASASHASLVGCQILIACRSGANLVKDQYTIQSVTSTTIVVTTTIDTNKTPQSGKLRVGDTLFSYTGFSGSTFTGVTPNPTGQSGTLYVPLLDVLAAGTTEQSDNIIFGSAFDVKVRVRKYGFKDFTLDTAFGSSGLAATPILATDPQAT
jgi:hypothetical protein